MSESCGALDVGCWLAWLQAELKALVVWAWSGLLDGLATLIEWIPVPEFLQDIGVMSLPAGVLYFANLFLVPQGFAMVVGAYVLRFILRRIPVIG